MPFPMVLRKLAAPLLLAWLATPALAQVPDVAAELQSRIEALQPKVVAWRRDIHAHPELSGQEIRTARLVAEHLRALGLAVKTGVGGQGVVGLLQGDLPGGVVALRADMDALPLAETTGLPFASRQTGHWQGGTVPVAHACGHDGHTAMLMGVAELLAGMKAQLRGSVKFVFQGAEEGIPEPDPAGAPAAASWGAKAMVEQGVLESPRVDAIFGLHIAPNLPVGTVGWRSGPMLAGADSVRISVKGTAAHAGMPWAGVDPIPVAAQIVTALQTVVSRQLDITREPAVLTIGSIHGGNRENLIPDTVEMAGSLRTFDEDMRADAKRRIARTADAIAAAAGAQASVSFGPIAYGVTANPAALVDSALPTLRRATGNRAVALPRIAGSEDFSEFQRQVPGFYFILGALPEGKTPATAAMNHSPAFDFSQKALPVGMRALALLALDHLERLAAPR
jgi:amidohydrolase